MKISKQIFTVVFLSVFIISASIITIFAESETKYSDIYEYTITDGEVTIDNADDKLNTVNIPEKLGGYPVKVIGDGAFGGSVLLNTVVLPEGLAEIEKMAFSYSKSLQSVNMPSTLKLIGDHAFYNCTSLWSITVPNGTVSIGERAFGRCTNLASISIPESVTSIGPELLYGVTLPTIYGKPGSYAQSYAVSEGIAFSDLITVMLNGKEVVFDQPPVTENYTTLVPMRAILESMGAEVSFDYSINMVVAKKDGIILEFQPDNTRMYVNGSPVDLLAPPREINNRTLVPVRAVANALGLSVEWDEINKIVYLSDK